MIKTIRNNGRAIVLAGFLIILSGQWAVAGSLYEYYTSASPETLKTETREMGKELSAVFSQRGISSRQQKIDFADYYSNMKKLVIYSSKLATYSEYGKDLRFARDNEVFKGLPTETSVTKKSGPQLDRKDFVNRKYGEMKKNVEEEIETYVDLIKLSLDACETLTQNDLSGFAENKKHQSRVVSFKRGKDFRDYLEKRGRLTETWPSLAARISNQLSLWDPRPASPDDPLINVKIAGAI
ncbi:MAG: hypothetical protein H8D55_00570 [Deltaproteobacteria bacterium]|nr:hypothetical protein [Deltaproteobacteria bacterium]